MAIDFSSAIPGSSAVGGSTAPSAPISGKIDFSNAAPAASEPAPAKGSVDYSGAIPKDTSAAETTPSPQSTYWSGIVNGTSFGPSAQLDTSGKPLLDYKSPGATATSTDQTRVDTQFDPTVAQKLDPSTFLNTRAVNNRAALKASMGGTYSDELDHKISLELSGSNQPSNLGITHGTGPAGASYLNTGDQQENYYAHQVATGQMSLFDAQAALAKWKNDNPQSKGEVLGANGEYMQTPVTGTQTPDQQSHSNLFGNFINGVKDLVTRAGAGLMNAITQNPITKALTTEPDQSQLGTNATVNALKELPSSIGENLPFGIGDIVKTINADPESAANMNLGDVISDLPDAAKGFLNGFVTEPVLTVAGGLLWPALHAVDPSSYGQLSMNIPGLGKVSNLQAQTAQDVADGADPYQEILKQTPNAIFDSLMVLGTADKIFGPREVTIGKGSVPVDSVTVKNGPEDFKVYRPPTNTTPIPTDLLQKMATEKGIDLSTAKNYDSTQPTYFRMEGTDTGGVKGSLVQMKPSYFNTFMNLFRGDISKVPTDQLTPLYSQEVSLKNLSDGVQKIHNFVSTIPGKQGGYIKTPFSGGSDTGSMPEEKPTGPSDSQKLIASGDMRIKSVDGENVYQYKDESGKFITAKNEVEAVQKASGGITPLKIPKEGVNHFVIYNKDSLKTTSELTDLYNKVKGETPSTENKGDIVAIARHGTTERNGPSPQFRGWEEKPENQLSEKGKEEAQGLGEKVKDMVGDNTDDHVIVSSDLNRAKDSAKIASEVSGVPQGKAYPSLRSQDTGDFTGREQSEVKDQVDDINNNHPDQPLPGASESHNDFVGRIKNALKPGGEIEQDNPGKKIIVVTHHQSEVMHANDFNKVTDAMFEKGIKPGGLREVQPKETPKEISPEEKEYRETMEKEIKGYGSQSVLTEIADRIVNGDLKIGVGKVMKTEAQELLGGHYMRLFTKDPNAESLDQLVEDARRAGEDVTSDDLIERINDMIAEKKAHTDAEKIAKEAAAAKIQLAKEIREAKKQDLQNRYDKIYKATLAKHPELEYMNGKQSMSIVQESAEAEYGAAIETYFPAVMGQTFPEAPAETPVNKKVNIFNYIFSTPENVLNKVGLDEGMKMLRTGSENSLAELPVHVAIIKDWKEQVENQPKSSIARTMDPNMKIFKYLDGALDELKFPLTETEFRIASEIKDYMEYWAERLELPEDRRLTQYITHVFDSELIKKEFDEDLAKIIDKKIPSEVYDPFMQSRMGARGYKQDTWKALEAYTKRAVRKANIDPALEKLKEDTVNPDGTPKVELSIYNYVRRYTSQINMRPTELETLIDNAVKSTPGIGYKLGQRPTMRVMKGARMMLTRASIGLNFGSAIKTIGQSVNAYSILGEKYTSIGIVKMLTNANGKELQDLGILRGNMAEQDNIPSVTKKIFAKMDPVLFGMYNIADRINKGIAYYGALEKYNDENSILDKTTKERIYNDKASYEKGIEYAKEIVRKSVFNFGAMDTPLAFGSDIAKAVAPFLSYSTKQAEFAANMIKDKNYAGILRYIAASFALVYFFGKALNLAWTDFNPFSIAGYLGKYGGPAGVSTLGSVANLLPMFDQVDANGNPVTEQQKVQALGTSLLTATIPAGAQINKSIQGYNTVAQGKTMTSTGRTKYNVTPSFSQYAQAILLGKAALPESQQSTTDTAQFNSLLAENKGKNTTLLKQAEQQNQELETLAQTDKAAAAAQFTQIQQSNPALAKEIIKIDQENQQGITSEDRQMKMLGVSNGTRAKYIWYKIQQMSTDAEKSTYIQSLETKKLLGAATSAYPGGEVLYQLQQLATQGK